MGEGEKDIIWYDTGIEQFPCTTPQWVLSGNHNNPIGVLATPQLLPTEGRV